MRIYLIGMLSGVMLAAAFAFMFAIPANNFHWQTEIWNRGGGTWTFDKNGRWDWKWTVKPIPDTPTRQPVIAPSSQVDARTEQL